MISINLQRKWPNNDHICCNMSSDRERAQANYRHQNIDRARAVTTRNELIDRARGVDELMPSGRGGAAKTERKDICSFGFSDEIMPSGRRMGSSDRERAQFVTLMPHEFLGVLRTPVSARPCKTKEVGWPPLAQTFWVVFFQLS